MRIGDVVRIAWGGDTRKDLCIVYGFHGTNALVASAGVTLCAGELSEKDLARLSKKQQAFVAATIAREALRRMGV